jgi:uncharacterized membrane protein
MPFMTRERYLELDIIRGFAISIMIFFHLIWDLDYYGLSQVDKEMYSFGAYFPTIFFILVGICLVISSQHRTTGQLLFRGTWIFAIGLVITAITTVMIPEKPVTFGVLHCIGISIILSTLLIRFKAYNLIIAPIFIIGGLIISNYHVQDPSLFHLAIGLHQKNIWSSTVDYFPLLPWFGVILLGLGIGNILYKNGKRQFTFPDISHILPVKAVSWLGKNSLVIYLLHQPVIAGTILYVFPIFAPYF